VTLNLYKASLIENHHNLVFYISYILFQLKVTASNCIELSKCVHMIELAEIENTDMQSRYSKSLSMLYIWYYIFITTFLQTADLASTCVQKRALLILVTGLINCTYNCRYSFITIYVCVQLVPVQCI